VPVKSQKFGDCPAGLVTLYKLENMLGYSAEIMNFGATLVSFNIPENTSESRNIVLGYDTFSDYEKDPNFLGVIVGRFANRIGNARITIDDQEYVLNANDGSNQLHGGQNGFDKALWNAKPIENQIYCGLKLTLFSPHLDQGFPGYVKVSVEYRLGNDGSLTIILKATTDQTTIINLTSHSYFNLSGAPDILGNDVKLFASNYTPVDQNLIPTGEIWPVDGTNFDFRNSKTISQGLNADDRQIKIAGGYDHNFVVDGAPGTLRPVAEIRDPVTADRLLVSSTQPGVQFYTGNNLAGQFQKYAGLCVETQHFPDSPNKPNFPSTLLYPEEEYTEVIKYQVF
jgi:aldose 1-epimerase